MRILIVSQYWFPGTSIPYRRWAWLSRLLTAEGHDVDVVAPDSTRPEKKSSGRLKLFSTRYGAGKEGPSRETVYFVPSIATSDSLSARALNQAFVALMSIKRIRQLKKSEADYKPDLIIGTVPAIATATTTWFAAKILGSPYVIDLRDAWPDLLHNPHQWNTAVGRSSIRERVLLRGPVQLFSLLVERVLLHIYRSSNGMIFTANGLKRSIEERCSLQDKPSFLIRNTFPDRQFNRVRPRCQQPLPELRVVYAGKLGRAQDLLNALEAQRIAAEMGFKVVMKFAGTGAARETLQAKINEHNLDTEMYPHLSAEHLLELYEWADTGLVALADWPALSNAVPSKLYELMSLGLHITAVANGETEELVRTLKAGDAVPPARPTDLATLWLSLIHDPKLLKVGPGASEWVRDEQVSTAPLVLKELIREVAAS